MVSIDSSMHTNWVDNWNHLFPFGNITHYEERDKESIDEKASVYI